MYNTINNAALGSIFDPPAFHVFRAAARSALTETFTADHIYLVEFDRLVIQPNRDSIMAVLALLTHALDDLRAAAPAQGGGDIGLRELLHPAIMQAAYTHFMNGHYRDAVLNSIMAVLQLLRERTGLTIDGDALVVTALSPNHPRLIVAEEWESQSGKDEQKGFMLLLQGAVTGIRNPKAHSLRFAPAKEVAAQYLVFASLLARRVENGVLAGAI